LVIRASSVFVGFLTGLNDIEQVSLSQSVLPGLPHRITSSPTFVVRIHITICPVVRQIVSVTSLTILVAQVVTRKGSWRLGKVARIPVEESIHSGMVAYYNGEREVLHGS
jgi:hypothetical protein